MPQLSVIILNFNTFVHMKTCVDSLVRMYEKEITQGLFEIVLVDNGSTDESYKKLSEAFSQRKYVCVIKNEHNLGFAKGCNQGAKTAKGAYVLFLNSDTVVSDRGFLDLLSYCEGHPETGVVGGRLVGVDGRVEKSAGRFYSLPITILELVLGDFLALSRYSPKKEEDVDWVSGGCMMVRKKLFDELGGFDEGYFMYLEDMDLCLRVRQKGYAVHFSPACRVTHVGQGSSSRSFAIMHIHKGVRYFYKKYKSRFEYVLVSFLLTLKERMGFFVGTITHNQYLRSTYKSMQKNI